VSDIRRIDAHVHLWQIDRADYFWMSPDLPILYRDFGVAELRPLLEQAGIDQVVLIQAAPTVAETEFLLRIAASSPLVAGVVGWVDLELKNVGDVLERLCRHDRFKGVRPMIQDIADPDWMLSASVSRGLDAIVQAGLVFEFLVRPVHLPGVREVLKRHPALHAVIDHGAKPAIASGAFNDWASEMAALARDTDVHCKLSGLVTEAGEQWKPGMIEPYVDHLLQHFGPRRLIFGSDWPVLNLASDYATWHRIAQEQLAGLTDAERDRVLGLNAADFYRL
jgi:L-fuconolactonase